MLDPSVIATIVVALLFITLVGHGIWVFFAFVFRGFKAPPSSSVNCPRCRSKLVAGRCLVCDWPLQLTAGKRSLASISEASEQIERFAALGLLDRAAAARILESLEAERLRLTNPLSPPVPTPAIDAASCRVEKRQDAASTSASGSTPIIAELVPEKTAHEAISQAVPTAEPAIEPLGTRDDLQLAPRFPASVHPLDQPTPAAPLQPPAPPRRPLFDLLSAFMEEQNIRWGELIGGLLIVGCSIALVISFWAKIAERPLLKFVVFNGVTAALFGLGFYAERRWRLRTTSRAVLLISILLVPLNFLAIAAFTEVGSAWLTVSTAGEAISIFLFAALTTVAARIIVPRDVWPMVAGVMLPSVVQLLVRRWVNPTTEEVALLAIGATPLVIYAVANLFGLREARQELAEPNDSIATGIAEAFDRPAQTLALLGATSFAALLPLGLLLFKTGHPVMAVHQLAVIISAAGLTPLAVGLFVWQWLIEPGQFARRISGLSIAVAGMLLLMAGVMLAWPEPVALVPTALLVAVVLSAIAIRFRLPGIHIASAACLMIAWLTVWHLAAGKLVWRGQDPLVALRAFVSGASGQALVPLVAILFGAAAVFGRWLRQAADAQAIAISAGGVAAISTALVSLFGFGTIGDPLHATWIYAIYGTASCIAAPLVENSSTSSESKLAKLLAWIGAALTLAACVQGIVYLAPAHWPLALPWATALLLHATLLSAATAMCWKWKNRASARSSGGAFGGAAILVSAVALVLIAGGSVGWSRHVSSGPLAIHWLWLAAVWFVLAFANSLPRVLFPAAQAALALAVWFCVGIWLEPRPWFIASEYPWLDPWTLQAEGIALAALCIAWMDVRRFVRGHRLATLFETSLAVDAILLRIVAVGLVALCCYAAWPGVAQEMSPQPILVAGSQSAPAVASNFEILDLPHIHAHAVASWLLLAIVVAGFVAEASQSGKSLAAWIVPALFMACPLGASWWEPQIGVASAMRWYAIGFLIIATAAIVVWGLWRRDASGDRATVAIPSGPRGLLVGLAALPALAGAAYAWSLALAHEMTIGPESLSLFGRMGQAISYAAPVGLFAIYLALLAIWERSDLVALAGGLTANIAATVAFVLRLSELHLSLDLATWIGLAQLNAIVAAIYVLAWAAWRARYVPRASEAAGQGSPIVVLAALAGLCNLAVLVPAWLKIVDDPKPTLELLAAGGIRGWLAAGLAVIAICAAGRLDWRRIGSGLPTVALFCFATLLAATVLHLDKFNWLGYRTLLVAHAAIGWLVVGLCWADIRGAVDEHRERVRRAVVWSVLALLVASFLAIRALFGVPHWPWWTIGALASQALLAVWLAWWSYRAALLYLAMPLLNLTASVWWFQVGGSVRDLTYVNIAALALPAIGWLAVELLRFRSHRRALADQSPYRRATNPAHRFAAVLSLVVLLFVVGIKLIATASTIASTGPATIAEWIALAGVVALWTAMLWNEEERGAGVGLYFAGLAAAAVALDQIHPMAKWLWWAGDAVLAAYAVATSFLWSRRTGLRVLADQLRIPRGPEAPLAGLRWLVPVNCTLAAIVVVLSYGFVLTYDDFAFRIVAAKAVLAQMLTLGLLVRGERRSGLQYASLVVGVLGAVAIGWAGLQPGAGTLLNRTVVVAAALAIAAAIYGLGLTKLLSAANEWLRAARRLTPVLIVLDVSTVLGVISFEIWQSIERHHVEMSAGAIATMAALLAGLAAAALAAAVLPGRDPLGLSLLRRQAYVYGAEALLVLLFVHLRLCVPQWFHGPLEKYWPLVVQGIAFLGVGLGEMFRRQRRIVVGEPLATTGALLPILPVLGYWVLPARVDYSLLLLTVGLVYGAPAVTRRSFGFGLLAVLAANGGMWFFLGGHEGFRFFEHPQLWMIPPALCVLIAAQLNRRQLTAEQMTAIRYASSIVIYVSSTADIFLQGVAHALWLPMVLAGLSIVGVLVGIVVRVRAFLILGTSFLMLSILTMIWYAAVDLQQTWLWYAAGIVVGVLILAVFAVFEKQRQAVTGLLDQLKKWQP